MLFVSIEFAVLVSLVFCLYWFVLDARTKYQNLLLLFASYVFYAWWDWRFLGLIIFSSLVDFSIGHWLGRIEGARSRKLLLTTSIVVNIGILGFFKYFHFFADSLSLAASGLGIYLDAVTLNIVLPVGISFYTFQTLSYTIDIYRRKIRPTSDVISFMTFVAFFPQLVAGPIERASRLLPQFERRRSFSYGESVDGLRQVLWGLFKKIVIADSCGRIVDVVFADYASMSSVELVVGMVLFAFQIYADFSGYSDVAIGVARIFGFKLMTNFRYPYFSRDVGEFWRRWHISLSTWFRDYVYIPLGGNRVAKRRIAMNVIAVFLISGLWHGANWTFVVWGLIHGLLLLPSILVGRHRSNTGAIAAGRAFPTRHETMQIISTFFFTGIAWIFFRAPSITDATAYLIRMFTGTGGLSISPDALLALTLISGLVVVEWINRNKLHPLADLTLSTGLRWAVYAVLAIASVSFSIDNNEPFIYFQF